MSDKDFDEFLRDIENLTESKIRQNKDTSSEKVEVKPKQKDTFKEIDLHGYDVQSAQRKVSLYVRNFFEMNPTAPLLHLRIITGKGRHSKEGKGKLIEDIYHFVKVHFKGSILAIDDPPAELKINSIPIRGHFEVRISK